MRLYEALTYDDVLLMPQYSDILSRKEVSLDSSLSPHTFRLPVISSPMDTVTGTAMASSMAEAGGLGVIHRYCTVDEQAKMIRAVMAV